ncbi:MAG: 2,3-bisphosphoglycerate-dependent phosphoglycerate mutase [Propionicimonas sp.]
MGILMLLRHGETTFNAAQVFTGLLDADLAPSGEAQVGIAARLIAADGLVPDVVWQSTMRRASRTTELLLGHLGRPDVPVQASWRLVERGYGCFTRLGKAEARHRYGEELFFLWRRTVHGRPPDADPDVVATWTDPAPVPERGPLDAGVGESLADVADRVLPFWRRTIEPLLAEGQTVFVVSHGNTLRALASVVFDLPDEQVEHLNIPAGHPLVVTFTDGTLGRPRYLDADTARAAADAVAAEGGT